MSMAQIIDGKARAARLRSDIGTAVAQLRQSRELQPGLAVVLIGEDPASQVYVRNKARQAREAGMNSFEHRHAADISQPELLELVESLNRDPAVHGVLVQLPLPGHIDANAVITAIDPVKDVDGFHPINVGRLGVGLDANVPCTPLGCLMLLREQLDTLAGRDAVVVGRSNIVGKPMAALLLRESCTVTIAHSRTRDLAAVCRRAEILVSAVGRANLITQDMVSPGATVIDVGMNRLEAADGSYRLVGDVDFAGVSQVAGAITPVPGGVGPMTIACLLANTLTAACRQNGVPDPEVPGIAL
jgi:methylenetetrahydrofolate dehydrogenase (NADP+)/methenyltetrahydrofolate cyclohydrolase